MAGENSAHSPAPARNSSGGIFGEQHQPGDAARRQPPSRIAGLHQPRQRPDTQRPEKQQRGVGRHDDAARPQHQRRVEKDGGTQPEALARQQPVACIVQCQRAQSRRQRPQQPDAERRISAQGGAELDPQRHHRRMVEIAGLQMLCPGEVIGLVRRQRQGGGQGKTQRCERQQCRKRPLHPTARARPGWLRPRSSTPRPRPPPLRRRTGCARFPHTAPWRCRYRQWRPARTRS